jgi:hypothetical protein
MEIFTDKKLKWLSNNGCIKNSFEEVATEERIMAMMENMDQRA